MQKAVAVYPMSNHGGVEILEINYGVDDAVKWRYYSKDEGESIIEYEEDGRAYFMVFSFKIYLDECMKVG